MRFILFLNKEARVYLLRVNRLLLQLLILPLIIRVLVVHSIIKILIIQLLVLAIQLAHPHVESNCVVLINYHVLDTVVEGGLVLVLSVEGAEDY